MKKKLIIFSLFAIGITTPVFSHNSLNTKTNCATNTSNLLAGSAGCSGSCECGNTCTDAFGTKYVCCSSGGLIGDTWGVKKGNLLCNKC